MGILTPDQLEKLPRALGDRFDFNALDIIVYKSLGTREINSIATSNWPMAKVASACLQAAENAGTTMAFLYYCVEQLRQKEPDFRDKIIDLLPEFADFKFSAKGDMDAVVDAIKFAERVAGDAAIRQALASMHDSLKQLADDVNFLDVHKFLHDCLHQLQVRNFTNLQSAARTLMNPVSKDTLRDYQDKLNPASAAATAVLLRLGHTVQNQQAIWVNDLTRTAALFQSAVDNTVAGTAMQALHKLRGILEAEPRQINRIIFTTAEALKLNQLIEALRAVGTATGSADAKSAAAALRNIRAILRGRVVEHQLWQDTDDALWAYDQVFMFPPELLFGDFDLLWPGTERMLIDLVSQDSGAIWAQNVARYMASVVAAKAELEQALIDPSSVEASILVERAERLRRAFGDVRAEARVRFFVVDQALKDECAQLVRIGDPLRALIAGLQK